MTEKPITQIAQDIADAVNKGFQPFIDAMKENGLLIGYYPTPYELAQEQWAKQARIDRRRKEGRL